MSAALPNPYIGPRAFEEDEAARFFGRERETADLFNLLIARRLVLLYAPSGAGKSSLIQAALIPRLRAERFAVHPPIRVGAPVPSAGAANRFTLAALLALDEGRAPAERLPMAQLARLSLSAYLSGRGSAEGEEVLVFDQFEELLTIDPADPAAKLAFMSDLGAVLDDPRYWAIFALREDYLGELQAYLRPIPTRLAATFRLGLLGAEAAQRAVRGPAELQGGEVTLAAAARLVDELRRSVVQRPDSTSVEVPGQAVEPVQLQVVCYRLWERLATGAAPRIDERDIEAAGAVDAALADYYASRVRAAASATGARERQIRDWVEDRLITTGGLRGQAIRQPEATDGLANTAIQALVDAHVLRADLRRGVTWYELTHDRLIGPIRADNAAWRARYLTPLQRQAAIWDQQGRREGLLLRGEALDHAEAGLSEAELSATERDFLVASRLAREAERRERRQNRRVRWLAVATLIGFLIASTLAALALALYNQAEMFAQAEQVARATADTAAADARAGRATAEVAAAQARAGRATAEAARADALYESRLAQAGNLATQAQAARAELPQRALLLAAEANRLTADAGDPPVRAAEQALYDALATAGGYGLRDPAGALLPRLSPDGRLLATVGADNSLRVWDLRPAAPAPLASLPPAPAALADLAFSPDNRFLVAGGEGGLVQRWDLAAGDPPASVVRLTGHSDQVTRLAFSPDGETLAAASRDGAICLWPGRADAPPAGRRCLDGPGDSLSELLFSPDGRWLVAAGQPSQIMRWDLGAADTAASATLLGGHAGRVNAIAISPDGQWLASASFDNTVRLWPIDDADPAAAQILIGRHLEAVFCVAFSPDGRWLASGGNDRTVQLWDLRAADPPATAQLLRGHDGAVAAVAFSHDGATLLSAGADGTVRVWAGFPSQAAAATAVLSGHEGGVSSLAEGAGGRLLSAGVDGVPRIWGLSEAGPALPRRLGDGLGRIIALAVGASGQLAAADERAIELWDLGRLDQPARRLEGHASPITAIQLSLDGRRLVSADEAGALRVWDLSSADPAAARALDGHDSRVGALALRGDGRMLASGDDDGVVRVWDLGAADPAAGALRLDRHQGQVGLIRFSADGGLALVADQSAVTVWDLDAPAAPAARYGGHGGRVSALAVNPRGRWLASGDLDGVVRIWDLQTYASAPAQTLATGGGAITQLAFSPDGAYLAATSYDGSARLWGWAAGAAEPRARPLLHHSGPIFALAFSPDGAQLATAGQDGSIGLWLTAADERSTPLALRAPSRSDASAPPAALFTLAFSPDARWLIGGGADGSVRLWALRPDELRALACATAGRDLRPDEWMQYFPDQPYRATCGL